MSTDLIIDASASVGRLARHYPGTIDIFERTDIDYACFGGRSVAEAANAAGADVEELVDDLRAAAGRAAAAEPSLPDLVHRIITEHHNIERDVIRDLLRDLNRHTEDRDVARIRRLLASLDSSMTPHMRREERELFPLVEQLALRPERIRAGMVGRRLFAEFVEHGGFHDRLSKIRELALRLRARGFGDRSLIDSLESLDRVAHRHMHLENNVLIPAVIELENRLRAERNLVTA